MKVIKDHAHFKPVIVTLESHAEAGAILRALREYSSPNYHIEALAKLLDEELNGSCSDPLVKISSGVIPKSYPVGNLTLG